MNHTQTTARLAELAAGTLDPAQEAALRAHVNVCVECRALLEDWSSLATATRIAEPPAHLTPRLRPAIAEGSGLLRVIDLVRAQVPVVNRNLWPASAVVIVVGFVLTVFAGHRGGGGTFAAVTPLIAATGLAFVYGPESDPPLEIALATPTSPRVVLLARMGLVFGYDLGLALLASSMLTAVGASALPLEAMILTWLGPMLVLSALSLAVAVRFGSVAGAGAGMTLWVLHLSTGQILDEVLIRAPILDQLQGTVLAAAVAVVLVAVVLVRLPGDLKPA